MKDYTPASYGDSFAGEDFEALHAHLADPASMVTRLATYARDGRALELGIGSGRVARPLAELGIPVDGIEASEELLDQLAARAGELPIRATLGSFADAFPERGYTLVYCVWNTFFSLVTVGEQSCLFHHVARVLNPDGVFLLEAFVPNPARFPSDQELRIRGITADSVSLQVSRHHRETQRIESQHVGITRNGITLHPHVIRYAWLHEIDGWARDAGLHLQERWAGWAGEPFSDSSTDHISVYGLASGS